MLRTYLTATIFVLLGTMEIPGQQSTALVGTWQGSLQGILFEVTFRQDGTGSITGDPMRWRIQADSLIITEEDGSETYNFRLKGGQLILSGGDLIGTAILSRVGGAAVAGSVPRAAPLVGKQMPPAGPRPETVKTAPATRPGGVASGSLYTHEAWGLSFATPSAWKVAPRQGGLILVSDTEAGLMILRFARGTSLNQLAQEYTEGIQEEGLRLMPAGPVQDFPAGQNKGLAGVLSGTARDGAKLQGRIIAVASPYNDAVVILGLTTEDKFSGLKPRVESLASSVSFKRPSAPPILTFLAGQYFYISTSVLGSSERYINLCSDGRYSERRDIYSSGSAGTAYGEAGESARWTAEGDETEGVIHVSYPNGSSAEIAYRRSGGDLIVGGRKYARYGDGSCSKSSPY